MKILYKCLDLLARTSRTALLIALVGGAVILTGLHAQGYQLASIQAGNTTPDFQPGDAVIIAPSGIPTVILPKFGYFLDWAQTVRLQINKV